MKRINMILRKCKTLSRLHRLSRTSSYSSLRSRSSREDQHWPEEREESGDTISIFVGSSRRRYEIKTKYLEHPLVNALIENKDGVKGRDVLVKCEVVIFDHLLWMLENDESNLTFDSLEELAQLYCVS